MNHLQFITTVQKVVMFTITSSHHDTEMSLYVLKPLQKETFIFGNQFEEGPSMCDLVTLNFEDAV